MCWRRAGVRGNYDYFEAIKSMAGIAVHQEQVNTASAMTGCYSLDEVRRLQGDTAALPAETLLGKSSSAFRSADSADATFTRIAPYRECVKEQIRLAGKRPDVMRSPAFSAFALWRSSALRPPVLLANAAARECPDVGRGQG